MKKIFSILLICLFAVMSVSVQAAEKENHLIYDYDFSGEQPFNTGTVCKVKDTEDELYGKALEISTTASQNTGGAIFGECRGINAKNERIMIAFDCMPLQTDTEFSFLSWNQNSAIDFRINLGKGVLYATNDKVKTEIIPITANEWYRVNVLLDYTKNNMTIFFNGKNVGCIPLINKDSNMLGAFFAGVWQKGTDGICYLDNLKIYDAEKYEGSEPKASITSSKRAMIKFSETIDVDCVDDIIKNTKIQKSQTGENVTLSEAWVQGQTLCLITDEEFAFNEEYIISLPETKSIRGKVTGAKQLGVVSEYGRVPTISEILGSIDFENGQNGKNITVSGKNSSDYAVVSASNGSNSLRYTAQRRSDGKSTELDLNVTGDDIKKRKLIVEYDFMLGQEDTFAFRHTMTDKNDKQMFNSIFNAKNKMFVFKYPNLHPDYKTCWESNSTMYAEDAEITGMKWHSAVIEFDRTNITDTYSGTTSVYIDGEKLGEFETPNVSGYSGVLDKLVFTDMSVIKEDGTSWGSNEGDVIYIDNVKIGYPETDKVTSVNAQKNGKQIPLGGGEVPEDAEGIKICFSQHINIADINKANISVYDEANCIDFDFGAYNYDEKSINLYLPKGLESGKKYKLSVKNMRNIYGEAIAEYNTYFTTVGENLFSPDVLNTHLKKVKFENNTLFVEAGYSLGNTSIDVKIKKNGKSVAKKYVTINNANETFNFSVPSSGGMYQLCVTANGKTEEFDIWAEDIIAPAKTEISCKSIGNIFYSPDEINFDINTANVSFDNSEYEIQYLVSCDDEKIMEKTESFITTKGESQENLKIDLSGEAIKYGIFDVDIKITDKKTNVEYCGKTRFSCVNATEKFPTARNYGFSGHYQTEFEERGDEYMALQNKIGMKYAREGISWYEFETEKGVYKLTDNRIKWLESTISANMIPFGAGFGYSNSRFTNENPPQSDEALKMFGDYVYNLVSMVKKYGVVDFEVWNEYNLPGVFNPDNASPEAYAKMLKVAYTEANRANEDAVIHGMVAANILKSEKFEYSTLEWMDRVFAAGGGQYMDLVSIHPYAFADTISPEQSNVEELTAGIRALLDKYGLDLPIVASEYGWMSKESYPDGEERQARYNVRGAAITYDLFNTLVWYQTAEIRDSKDYGFIKAPSAEIPYEAKKTYVAMANFIKMTADKQLLKKNVDDNVYNYTFGNEDDLVHMLWTDDRVTEYSTDIGVKEAEVCDMYGNCKVLSSETGVYTIQIDGEPVYLKVPKKTEVHFISNGKKINNFAEADKEVEIEVANQDKEIEEVYVASYSEKTLISIEKKALNEKASVSTENVDMIKVFLWKNDMIPFTEYSVLE